MTSSINSRLLGSSEQFLWHLDTDGCMNFAIIGHLKGPVDIETLNLAIQAAQDQNTVIKCRITMGKNGLEFTTKNTPSIPFTTQHMNQATFCLDQAVNTEINTPFDTEKMPLLRATLYQNANESKLILTFNHILCDGKASIYILEKILEEYKRISTQKSATRKTPYRLPLETSLETALPTNAKKHPIKFLTYLSKLIFQSVLKKSIHIKNDTPNTDTKNVRSGTKMHTFNEAETQQIIVHCKEKKISVNALLCAVMIKQTVILSSSTSQKNNVAFFTPIDMRPYSNLDQNACGCYISAINPWVDDMPTDNVETLANKIQNRIKKELKLNHHFFNTRLQEIVLKLKKSSWIVKLTQSHFLPVTGVTNVGIIKIKDTYGPLQLNNITFSVSCHIFTGIPRIGLGVSTFNKRLSISLLYNSPYLSDKNATASLRNIVTMLLKT